MKIIYLGDIVGRIGRKAIKKALPELRARYDADVVLANAENLAHGHGVTTETLKEMMDAGIDFFTSGNHIWDNKAEINEILSQEKWPIIRPANYPLGVIGDGWRIIEIGIHKILIINLMGRVFFRENFDCPFRKMEAILEETKNHQVDAIIVDLHAEATSEKITFGHYFDGRASLIVGTHTHVQTADERALPKGTGYISDLGMTGAKNSSLGVELTNVIKMFLEQTPQNFELVESGTCQINGIFAIIKQKKIEKIERLNFDLKI